MELKKKLDILKAKGYKITPFGSKDGKLFANVTPPNGTTKCMTAEEILSL